MTDKNWGVNFFQLPMWRHSDAFILNPEFSRSVITKFKQTDQLTFVRIPASRCAVKAN